MPVSKNALLRYSVIDRCLRNTGRRYTFEELRDAVGEAMAADNPQFGEVSVRQLRDDLRFLKSEAGYGAPIITVGEGRKRFYRYEYDFSINKSPLNDTELAQLKQAISLLRKFEGRQEFEWLNELGPQLDDKLGAKDHKPIIGYETNLDYSGAVHIPDLFNAILNKRVLSMVYKPFNGEPIKVICHPYYLKQYNGRWFLFGRNEELDHNQWNFPLDRIVTFIETDKAYRPDTTDWEEYFFDIVGVTRKSRDPEDVVLLFEKSAVLYVTTKPLHPTQRVSYQEDGRLKVTLKVIPNFELESLILGFGENVHLLAPQLLQERLKERVRIQYSRFD